MIEIRIKPPQIVVETNEGTQFRLCCSYIQFLYTVSGTVCNLRLTRMDNMTKSVDLVSEE